MSRLPWFRLYHELLTDRKIERVCRMTQQPKALVVGTWVTLLCLANDSPQRGTLLVSEEMPVTDDELGYETGLDPVTLGKLLNAFMDCNMLSKASAYTITNWDARQFDSDNSTARVRRHRARKRAKSDEKQGETLQQRSRNVIETEADTDTEAEKRAPHPTATAWQSATGHWLDAAGLNDATRRLGTKPDMDALNAAAELWREAGYSPRNVEGICDWYEQLRVNPDWRPATLKSKSDRGPKLDALKAAIRKYGRNRYKAAREELGDIWPIVSTMGKWADVCNMTEREIEINFHKAVNYVTQQ